MPQDTITTTPTSVLSKNPYRRSIIFHNPSTNVIFVGRGPPSGLAAANASFRIPSGSTRTLDWFHDGEPAVTDEWSAIADTGSNTFETDEFIDKGKTPTVSKIEVITGGS